MQVEVFSKDGENVPEQPGMPIVISPPEVPPPVTAALTFVRLCTEASAPAIISQYGETTVHERDLHYKLEQTLVVACNFLGMYFTSSMGPADLVNYIGGMAAFRGSLQPDDGS